MLQIKKISQLIKVKYNLLFLFRRKKRTGNYIVKKQKTTRVFVRAPKHFNIGKQKIVHLNYKMPTLSVQTKFPVHMHTFLTKPGIFYNSSLRAIKTNPCLSLGSAKFCLKTTFKLMWLEI